MTTHALVFKFYFFLFLELLDIQLYDHMEAPAVRVRRKLRTVCTQIDASSLDMQLQIGTFHELIQILL